MKVITPEQMKMIEEKSEMIGVSRTLLMENAGHEVADHILDRFHNLKEKKIVVVAGTGNNGGDGFVVARHLAPYGAEISVILLGRSEDIKTVEASLNWRILTNMSRSVRLITAPDSQSLAQHKKIFEEADIVVDAVFGTGIKGAIREPHSSAIDFINGSSAYKVAVDLPSGLDPLTGEVHDKAVRVDATVTFHNVKKGLLDREELTGELIVAPIGVPPEAEG